MTDFTDYQGYKSSTSKVEVDHFTTKVLIPLGSVLIATIGLLSAETVLPTWAYWIMMIYLGIVLVKILVGPIKKFISNIINRYNKMHFAKQMKLELLSLSRELNELLESQRINSVPYFITHLLSKLSQEVQKSNCLHRNSEQFTILQSWAWCLSDNLKFDNHKLFLRNANQFSRVVSWFTWACEWVRQVLDKTEVREKIPKDVLSDWNLAVQRISDFTSRVERMMKSINNNYKTSICITSFQDVKPF